jgi:hypothetical protein
MGAKILSNVVNGRGHGHAKNVPEDEEEDKEVENLDVVDVETGAATNKKKRNGSQGIN